MTKDKMQEIYTKTKKVFITETKNFSVLDKELTRIRTTLIKSLYDYCNHKISITDSLVKEEFELNKLFKLTCEFINKTPKELANSSLRQILYVVVKGTILKLHSDKKEITVDGKKVANDFYNTLEFAKLTDDEKPVKFSVRDVEDKKGEEVIYRVVQDELTVPYNYLQPTFKVKNKMTQQTEEIENVDDTQINFNNDAIKKVYGKLFATSNSGDENESDYENNEDEYLETMNNFYNFITTTFKNKDSLTFFYDEQPKKVLLDIMQGCIAINQRVDKLLNEDAPMTPLQKAVKKAS
tara:strand:+ start:588 stop:1472 length:885 start_codon:yes stop_codon:yes gene_type:complete